MDIESELFLQQTIERFWEVIPPVWGCIKGNVRTIATESFGITIEQFHILRHIRKGMVSVSELAKEKQISRSAISQAVDLLVEKGLIVRRQTAEDRRWVTLELTPQGETLINAIFDNNHRWMTEKLKNLSQDELNTLLGAMDIFKSVFHETNKTN